MPVFHTKTIESILEPVAQQVSKLVILHEEAEDGNAMPDLAKPVQAVKIAVDNLVRVGHDTCNNSEDLILKQDMPPALHRVEEASYLLLDASEMLRADPYSAPARKKLIEGSRGILQGTSGLLLAFDESEVRKIIRICKNVLEYLAITEVVETMEDLVTFVKNLSPVLTKMTKEVDAREKELTHQVHRDMLIRSLERVKQLTPVLISGVKIYIGTKEQGGHGLPDAQHNRDYVVHEMSNEIHEIIRVLQLTTYDEDEWDADDITVMKKALNALEGKMKQAQDWLMDPNGLIGGAGERSIRMILEDAAKAADRCADPRERDEILRVVSDLTSMVDALAELRQAGQGDSPQAQSLARGIQQKLGELQQKVAGAITNTERSGLRRPAHTVAGKVDQAQRWLSNPGVNDMGLGEQAARLVTDEGRRIAETLPAAQRADMLRLCDDTERLTNQLAEMCRRGMANTPQARALAGQLSHKLHQLKGGIQDALVDQVADDFMDIGTPLKLMSDAANAPFGTPNRDAIFEDRAVRFENHAHHLAQTAQMVAAAGGSSNRKTIEGIFGSVNQVNDLAPEIVRAARIVLMNPKNQAATEHFDMLKRQWTEQMEKLRGLVDDAIDTAAFIKATESGILKDTEQTEQAIRSVDPPGVVNNTSSIARRANRVLQVAQQEADNSEDPHFVDRVNNTIRELRSTITPMVQNAKGVAQNVTDPMAAQKWRGANQQLIDAVGNVRQAVTPARPDYPAGMMDDFPAPPDLSQLHISDKVDPVQAAPYRSSPVIKFQHRHSPVPAQLVRSTAVPVQVSRLKSESPVPAHSAPRHQGSPYGYGRDSPYDMAGQYMPAHTPPARQRGRGSPRDAFFSDTDQSYYSEPELIPQHGFGQNQANRGYHSPFHSAGQSHAKSGQAGMPYGVTPTLDIDLDELMKSAEKTKKSLQDATRVPPDVPPPPSDYHIQASQATGEYSSAPPVPPPPASYDYYNDQSSEYSYDSAPPRPPPPSGSTVPPRPPPPESEDEDDTHFPTPQANQPIMMAAHALHMDVKQWSSRDNEIIGAAKRMALLMAKLSQLVRGEGGKKELIDTAKAIAEASEEVARLAMNLAKECTDKRMRTSLLQVCERIPTIGTQLKILSTVKATMLGAQEPVPSPDGSEINCGSEEDEEATEMLIGNAQNLMQSVSSTVRAAQAASIKIRVDSGYQIRWLRKKPWYQ